MEFSTQSRIKDFLDSLKIDKGSSAHTINAYARDLLQFEECIKRPLPEATERDIQNFLKLLKEKDQKSTSIARKISAIKQFYKFLLREAIINEDPSLFIEVPALAQKLPKAMPPEAVLALLAAADDGIPYTTQIKAALNLRDRAMIYLLYATGVRVSELISVELSKCDTEACLVRVMGKRSKERMIPFAPIAGEIIHEYITHARPLLKPNSPALFLSERGQPLTRQAFWQLLKKLAQIAGISAELHPHMLRHTFATDLLKSGMNLRSVQMLLGHADLQTTEIYTHIAPERLQEVVKRFHPRGGNR